MKQLSFANIICRDRARRGAVVLLILLSTSPGGRAHAQNSKTHAEADSLASTLPPQPTAAPSGAGNSDPLASAYLAGGTALKAQDWPNAIKAFEGLLQQVPDYREARQLLAQAQQALRQDSTDTVLSRYYVEGLKARQAGDWQRAANFLRAVQRENPNFHDVAHALAQVEQEMQRAQPPQPDEAIRAVPPDSLRQMAQRAAARQDWAVAVAALQRLEKLQPGNFAVDKEMEEARAHLQIAEMGVSHVEAESEGRRLLWVGMSLAAVLGLPLLGIFAASSANRARLHVLRGNYKRAAQLYENLLLRHPDQLKIYPRLAQVYLGMGRQDETALRVFKTVLQLNFPMPQRERINEVLATSYLGQGHADQEAIAVLENALQEELRRQQRG